MPLSEATIAEIQANAGDLIGHETLFPVLTKTFSEKGFTVLDEKGRNELLENFKKSEIPKLVGDATKDIHGYYDKDLKEVYGESDLLKPRDGETKTYHVNKRLHIDNQKRIKELEEKLAAGDHKEFYEKKLKEEREEAHQLIQAKNKEIETFQANMAQVQKESKYNEAFLGVRSKIDPSNFEDEMFKEAEASIKQNVLKNSKLEDGVFVMTNPDGTVMKDSSFKPVPVSEYLEKKFSGRFKKDPAGGGGTGAGDPGQGAPKDPTKLTPENWSPGNVTTKSELLQAMAKAGLTIGTAQEAYVKIYAHFTKALKLEK